MEGFVYFLIFCWIFTVIFTIVLAVSKGYNGFLAFLLGLFIPLLGSLIVIALLPNKNLLDDAIRKFNSTTYKVETITYSGRCRSCGKEIGSGYTSCPHCGSTDLANSIPINKTSDVEQKICRRCGEKVDADIFVCPKCGCEAFK